MFMLRHCAELLSEALLAQLIRTPETTRVHIINTALCVCLRACVCARVHVHACVCARAFVLSLV